MWGIASSITRHTIYYITNTRAEALHTFEENLCGDSMQVVEIVGNEDIPLNTFNWKGWKGDNQTWYCYPQPPINLKQSTR